MPLSDEDFNTFMQGGPGALKAKTAPPSSGDPLEDTAQTGLATKQAEIQEYFKNRGTLANIGATAASGLIGAGESTLRMIRGGAESEEGPVANLTTKGLRFLKNLQEEHPSLRLNSEDKSISSAIEREVAGGISSVPAMVAGSAGATLGALTAPVTGPAGPAIGMGAGFGLASARQKYDEAKERLIEAGMDPEKAKDLAWKEALAEGGIAALGGTAFGLAGNRLASTVGKKALEEGAETFVRPTLRDIGKRIGTTTGIMGLQGTAGGGATSEIEKEAGVGDKGFVQGALEAAPSSFLGGAIFGGLDVLHMRGAAKHTIEALEDGDASLRARAGAVNDVYQRIAQQNPDAAVAWLEQAENKLRAGEGINTKESLLKPQTQPEQVASAQPPVEGEQLSLELPAPQGKLPSPQGMGEGFNFYDVPAHQVFSPELADQLQSQRLLIPESRGFMLRSDAHDVLSKYSPEMADQFSAAHLQDQIDGFTRLADRWAVFERPAAGISAEAANSAIAPISKAWQNAPRGGIVAHPFDSDSTPESIRATADRQGAADRINAAYDPATDTIHVFSDRVSSPEEAQRLVMEEAMHRGIRSVTGKAGDRVFMSMWDSHKQGEILKIARDRGIDTNTREGKINAAEEWFAHGLQTDSLPQSFMNQVVRVVKEWIRAAGINLKLSDQEIADLVRQSREYQEKGQGKNTQGNVVFSYAGRRAAGFAQAEKEGRVFEGKYDREKRFEIDDSKATLKNYNDLKHEKYHFLFEPGSKMAMAKLGEILNHPNLFKNYPELKNLDVVLHPGWEGGRNNFWGIEVGYDPTTGKINKPNLFHEIQHELQDKEDFATGGGVGDLTREERRDAIKRVYIAFLNSNPSLAPEAALKKSIDYIDSPSGQEAVYRMLAGEIEARDVATRVNMSQEQRAKTAPFSSESIKPEDAIVRRER
jgi:hypothetical protein